MDQGGKFSQEGALFFGGFSRDFAFLKDKGLRWPASE
jgi:hypothetical protein